MKKRSAFAYLASLIAVSIFGLFADSPALASPPVTFKQLNHFVIIPVLINGAGPFDFIFDTGASSTVIDHELAKQLEAPIIGSTTVITAAGSTVVPRYSLGSLAAGPKSVENLIVFSTEMREIRSINSTIRGILGQDFLSRFNYILNYRDRCIEFEADHEFETQVSGARLAVERDRGRMLVEAKTLSSSKNSARLVIDSGASSIVVFGDSRESGFDIEADLNGMNGMVNVSSIVGSQVVRTGSIRNLQIGEEKFTNLAVRIGQSRRSVESRAENGLLPASLFRAIYFNSRGNFVVLNPRFDRLLMQTSTSIAQTNKVSAPLGNVSTAALAYFEKIHNRSFDDYLETIRPGSLAPELKARVLAMLRKEDIVTPSVEGRAKLAALEPVLKYHDRSSVIDPKVIRVGQAVVMFLAGAAVLISEEALDMLTAEELQAVVAHELGHEYFWNEYELARQNKQYDKIPELELRCDGLAVVTMCQLGLGPSHFISAITKLTNSHKGKLINPDSYVALDERIRFIEAMIEIVKARSRGLLNSKTASSNGQRASSLRTT